MFHQLADNGMLVSQFLFYDNKQGRENLKFYTMIFDKLKEAGIDIKYDWASVTRPVVEESEGTEEQTDLRGDQAKKAVEKLTGEIVLYVSAVRVKGQKITIPIEVVPDKISDVIIYIKEGKDQYSYTFYQVLYEIVGNGILSVDSRISDNEEQSENGAGASKEGLPAGHAGSAIVNPGDIDFDVKRMNEESVALSGAGANERAGAQENNTQDWLQISANEEVSFPGILQIIDKVKQGEKISDDEKKKLFSFRFSRGLESLERAGYENVDGVWLDSLLPLAAKEVVKKNAKFALLSGIDFVEVYINPGFYQPGAFLRVVKKGKEVGVCYLPVKDGPGNIINHEQYMSTLFHEAGHAFWQHKLGDAYKQIFRLKLGNRRAPADSAHAELTYALGEPSTGAEPREESFADYFSFAASGHWEWIPDDLRSFFKDLLMQEGIIELQTNKTSEKSDKDGTQSAIAETPGGIDLTPANLELQRQGMGITPFDLSNQGMENIEIDGLFPVIINVMPVTNLPLLFGASAEDTTGPAKELSLAN